MEITIPSSCGDNCIQQSSGRQLRWYRPNHQVFNVLSYPTSAPPDYLGANRIWVGDRILVGLRYLQQILPRLLITLSFV